MQNTSLSNQLSTPKKPKVKKVFQPINGDTRNKNDNITETTDLNNVSCSFNISKSNADILISENGGTDNKNTNNDLQNGQISFSIFSDLDSNESNEVAQDDKSKKPTSNTQEDDNMSFNSNKIKNTISERKEGSCTPSVCNYYLKSNDVTPNKQEQNINKNSSCSNLSNDINFNNIKQVNLNLVYNNMNFNSNLINQPNLYNIANDITHQINSALSPKSVNNNIINVDKQLSPKLNPIDISVSSPSRSNRSNKVGLIGTISNNKINIHHEHNGSGLSNTTNKRTPLKYTRAQCCGGNNEPFSMDKLNKKNLMENFLADNVLNNISQSSNSSNNKTNSKKEKSLLIQNEEDTLQTYIQSRGNDSQRQITECYTGNAAITGNLNENCVSNPNQVLNFQQRIKPKNVTKSDFFIERQFTVSIGGGGQKITPKFAVNKMNLFEEDKKENKIINALNKNNEMALRDDSPFMLKKQSNKSNPLFHNGFKLREDKSEKNDIKIGNISISPRAKVNALNTLIKRVSSFQSKSLSKEKISPNQTNSGTMIKKSKKVKSVLVNVTPLTLNNKNNSKEKSSDILNHIRSLSARPKKLNNKNEEKKILKVIPIKDKLEGHFFKKTDSKGMLSILEKKIYTDLFRKKFSSSVGRSAINTINNTKSNLNSISNSNSKGKNLQKGAEKEKKYLIIQRGRGNKTSTPSEHNSSTNEISNSNTLKSKNAKTISSNLTPTLYENKGNKGSFVEHFHRPTLKKEQSNFKQKSENISFSHRPKSETKIKSKSKTNLDAVKIKLSTNRYTLINNKNTHQKIQTQSNLFKAFTNFGKKAHSKGDRKRNQNSLFNLNYLGNNDSKKSNRQRTKLLHTQETTNTTSTGNGIMAPNNPSPITKAPTFIENFSFYQKKNKTKNNKKKTKSKADQFIKTESSITIENNSLQMSSVRNSQYKSIKIEKLKGDDDWVDSNEL
ncbi:MAG: hypothetical protein MJ252_06105 [archaeon]|nr:hypothetical protein [archaeon]